MPVSVLILAAALAQEPPAQAALPDILIPELRLGMDKQQFHASWPDETATVAPGCTLTMAPTFRHTALDRVTLRSTRKGTGAACLKTVFDRVHAELGKPENEYSIPPNSNGCFQSIGGLSPDAECGPHFIVWEQPRSWVVMLEVRADEWWLTIRGW